MKRTVLAMMLFGCDPAPEIDIPPIDLGGYTIGDHQVAGFALADGCTIATIFGCDSTLPPLAVDADARLVVTPLDAEADGDRLAHATARSVTPGVATATRDTNGLLIVHAVAAGSTTIELVDDGEVVDSIHLDVREITRLGTPMDSNVVLAGARIGARVVAFSDSRVLYARGAIAAAASGALALLPDNSGFFLASEQVAVGADAPGAATVSFDAGPSSLDVPYTVVTRADVTRVAFGTDVIDASAASKSIVFASAYVGDALVRGGPACDWRIVSGGGPSAAIADRAGDDTNNGIFPVYTAALVYGAGDVVVECRANDQAMAQVTVRLHP